MDLLFIRKLMNEDLLDFDKLLKQSYRKIGLNETEAFLLMALNSLKNKGINQINATLITKHLSVSDDEAIELLDQLLQRGYLSFSVIEDAEGLVSESFSIDPTLNKIISYYHDEIDQDIVKTSKSSDTDEHEIAEILETHLQRQLKPLEVEVIIKWIKEHHYNKHMIKDAIIESVKSGKTSVSYIDGILLKKTTPMDKTMIKTNRKKSKVLKDFLES